MQSILNVHPHLKALIEAPLLERRYAFSLFQEGFPAGVLIELSGSSGSGKTEVILRFLKENEALNVAWVEKDFTLFPATFPQYSIDLSRVLFIERAPLMGVYALLKSQLFQVIVLFSYCFIEVELRRLQLLAKKAQTLVFLLQTAPTRLGNWPISLQIKVVRQLGTDIPQLSLLRRKGSALWKPSSTLSVS